MSKRIGAQTTALPSCPGLIGWAGIAGQKEKEGPYGAKFDWIIPDELNGEQSFESAERAMLEQAVVLCAEKAGTRLNEIQMLLAGDLLNQIISAGFAARNLGIPFYGLYGACSTMSESLSVGGMLADGGFADRLICATCSHFCTAERQYRAPLELGNQRTPTAQDVLARAQAGEDFDSLVETYGQDTGMNNEPNKSRGYLVCDGLSVYEQSFQDAAMALEKVGDVSAELVKTSYGYHILQYATDIAAGEVEYTDEIKSNIYDTMLSDAKDAAYEAAVTQWVSEAKVTTYPKVMK